MADVWNQAPYPSYAHSPQLVQVDVDPPALEPGYVEPLGWQLLKHAIQLGVVAVAFVFAAGGAANIGTAVSFGLLSLLLMFAIAYADRQRFLDSDPRFELVAMVEPRRPQPPAVTVRTGSPARREAALAPLVEEMARILPNGVDVT